MQLEARERRVAALIPLGLVVLCAAVYGQTLGFDFVNYDDEGLVVRDPGIALGVSLEGVRYAFRSTEMANWVPLTRLSYLLDHSIHGAVAGGYHATNVLLHSANTVLLFWIFAYATGRVGAAAVSAVVLAVHPLHVGSVAWIAERRDVLFLFFGLSSIGCYFRYARSGSLPAYAGALALFVAGLLSKPMLVTLPFVLLLLDVWPLERSVDARRRWIEKIPFFAFSLAICAVTYAIQSGSGAMRSAEAFGLGYRLENAVVAYGRYLGKIVFPYPLLPFYAYSARPSHAAALVSGALLAGVTYWAWRTRREQPNRLVGWLWFLGTLVPAIGIVHVGLQSVADRYAYLPLVGLTLINPMYRRGARTPSWVWIPIAAAGAALAIATHVQTGYWRDSVTLWAHTLRHEPDNVVAHANLGRAYAESGRDDLAMPHLRRAQQLAIDSHLLTFQDVMNLAGVHAARKEWQLAETLYRSAARRDPTSALAYRQLGSVLILREQPGAAAELLRGFVERDPSDAGIWFVLATALGSEGKLEQARAAAQRALELEPTDDRVRRLLDELGD